MGIISKILSVVVIILVMQGFLFGAFNSGFVGANNEVSDNPLVEDTKVSSDGSSADIIWKLDKDALQDDSIRFSKKAPVSFTGLSVGWSPLSYEHKEKAKEFEIHIRTKDKESDFYSDWVILEKEDSPENIPSDKYWSELYLTPEGELHDNFEIKFVVSEAVEIDKLKVSVFDASAEDEVSVSSVRPSLNAPEIITREGWWGDLPQEEIDSPRWPPSPASVTHSIVHHTATQNNPPAPKQVVRNIWHYHANTLGWGDIGYNFLIDHEGNIYQGRHNPWLEKQDVVAGHAYGTNYASFGVGLIGQFDSWTGYPGSYPSSDAVDSLEHLIAWRFRMYNLDPTEKGYIAGYYTERLSGHRDVGDTTCPGDNLYSLLPGIRENVKSLNTKEFQVELEASPEEGGSVSGGGTYKEGEKVEVNAVEEKGYEFVGWSEGDKELHMDSEYIFEASSDRELVANFEHKIDGVEWREKSNPENPTPPDKSWEIKFNMELNQNSVNENNFYIRNEDNGEFVEKEVKLSEDDTVELKPVENYEPGGEMAIYIMPEVESEDGTVLGEGVKMFFEVEK